LTCKTPAVVKGEQKEQSISKQKRFQSKKDFKAEKISKHRRFQSRKEFIKEYITRFNYNEGKQGGGYHFSS
jgi:hypothetical protein